MDDDIIVSDQIDEDHSEHAVICGFWKRILASILDGILIGIAGVLIGIALFDLLAQLGGWGRLVGFCIAIAYFGIFNSGIGKGQTIGKKIMKIHVVDRAGGYISLPKSFLRYAVLGVPFFLNGALIPNSVIRSPLGYVFSLLVFGFGAAIFYLYVFNRKTRQSLHDLIAGTFVTKAKSAGEVDGAVWPVHRMIVGLLLLLAAGLPLATKGLAETWEFPELMAVQDRILESGLVHHASAQAGKSWGTSNDGKNWEKTYFSSVAVLKERPDDPERAAEKIAQIILKQYPLFFEKDVISVTVTYGFDIGIARAWRSFRNDHRPEEWRQILEPVQ